MSDRERVRLTVRGAGVVLVTGAAPARIPPFVAVGAAAARFLLLLRALPGRE